jgi:hypothetical protein
MLSSLRGVFGAVALVRVAGSLLPEPNRVDTGEFARSMGANTIKSCGRRSMNLGGGMSYGFSNRIKLRA